MSEKQTKDSNSEEEIKESKKNTEETEETPAEGITSADSSEETSTEPTKKRKRGGKAIKRKLYPFQRKTSEERAAQKREKKIKKERKKETRREKRLRRQQRRLLKLRPPTNFKKEVYAVPNLITYLRILLLPVILIVVEQDSRWHGFMAGMIFWVACMTDFFDGYAARKLNQVTILGKLLDPLADKLIVSSILIMMVPMGRVPAWIVIILLAREFTITGLRGIAASEGMVIAASWMGKWKTVFQMLALYCLLIHYPFRINFYGLFALDASFHNMGMFFLYLSLFYSLASAVDYFWKFAKEINKRYTEAEELLAGHSDS